MNKLAAARVVLVALEKQEQKLLEQLCSVRVAARAQRAKVEKLIKRLPTLPIKRFPNELLLRVFELVVHPADFPRPPTVQLDYKKCLAVVSRPWRTLVLDLPTLWFTIEVKPARGDE
ncbi:hypothetical protein BKA82DRAFT_1003495 [Pisolithus tinctorius]|uniref:Uncharacterized protein n=1 Tax=Pisolithus tinctorius Marx 270 TaxID=870435 RepID=A0A0C3JTH1_PISTI|nr:hypothetical protein BKA82DRAFT_1003495 [Pisolithus tinctorius]KIO00787.1 hypothetical protein M404DRAFT_1003495 [Pisolithus tinctorius Marx 270]